MSFMFVDLSLCLKALGTTLAQGRFVFLIEFCFQTICLESFSASNRGKRKTRLDIKLAPNDTIQGNDGEWGKRAQRRMGTTSRHNDWTMQWDVLTLFNNQQYAGLILGFWKNKHFLPRTFHIPFAQSKPNLLALAITIDRTGKQNDGHIQIDRQINRQMIRQTERQTKKGQNKQMEN